MNLTAVPNQYPFEAENVSESIKMYYEYFHVRDISWKLD